MDESPLPLKVFIDTEFTDFIHTSLISIGMVAETGEELYAEVPYPEAECSDFVRVAVIPLLGREPNAACEFDQLRSRILTWLGIVRSGNQAVEICFDYQTDWDLFVDALDYRIPDWCRPRLVASNISELLLYSFQKETALPLHHALYDARANRYAFREALAPNS